MDETAMTTLDPPSEAPTPQVIAPLDPAVAVQVILVEAEYLRAQTAAIMRASKPRDITHLDLSPLGR
jgi:hypothetical protein